MYAAKIRNYELNELMKTGILIEGFGQDSDKPIKFFYTSKQKPILLFKNEDLELISYITSKIDIHLRPIPIDMLSIRDFFELLEKDNLESLVN